MAHIDQSKSDSREGSDHEEKEDEESFLNKYKLNGELPKKIPYSHEIFKPSPPIEWDDLKSYKEKIEKNKSYQDF